MTRALTRSLNPILLFAHSGTPVLSWLRASGLAITMFACWMLAAPAAHAQDVPKQFLTVLAGDPNEQLNAVAWIDQNWDPSFAPMALETMWLTRAPRPRMQLLDALQRHSGQEHGFDLRKWLSWIWTSDIAQAETYPTFKQVVYGLIDPKFRQYFDVKHESTIRLTEVIWGGVRQDGIPPLRGPKMLEAAKAEYLADTDVVFGIVINGDARAYPKRILAWHEMFTDSIGGVPVAGVYCTLCGAVIAYGTNVNGVQHDLGTSGFLYRSNKLMYDRATQSLWSTMRGTPVIGALVGKDIVLPQYPVVTTTWGEWRAQHPQSTVLSLETGHQRDYGEGVAYRQYFATDALMFPVPQPDDRLKNKAEVLALVGANGERVAIAQSFLAEKPVHHDAVGDQNIVVLTSPGGANRVYAVADAKFTEWNGTDSVTAADGSTWTVTEDALKGPDGQSAARLPAHRAFWFGWHAAFPSARLVN